MIHRVFKSSRFTQLSNDLLWDKRISSKAKAVLAAVLAFPETCTPTMDILAERIKEGKAALKSAFKELSALGYVSLVRKQDELGRWRSGYEIYEEPTLNPNWPPSDLTLTTEDRFSDVGKPPHKETLLDVGREDPVEKGRRRSTWGRALEDWVERLSQKGLNPRQVGDGWTALCPCHKDSKPSLSVRSGKRRSVVAKCHAGCRFEDIAAFLFESSPELPTTYTYTDEHDHPVFRVRRLPEKRFMVESANGDRWKRGYKGAPLPYRLPELVRAVRDGQCVWIVEGEKDVETLRLKGLVATCNPFGAGKWRFDLNHWFEKANVVIVADKDEAGFRHARDVYRQLLPNAASCRIVRAAGGPEVNDATDHFEAGFTLSDFAEVFPADDARSSMEAA